MSSPCSVPHAKSPVFILIIVDLPDDPDYAQAARQALVGGAKNIVGGARNITMGIGTIASQARKTAVYLASDAAAGFPTQDEKQRRYQQQQQQQQRSESKRRQMEDEESGLEDDDDYDDEEEDLRPRQLRAGQQVQQNVVSKNLEKGWKKTEEVANKTAVGRVVVGTVGTAGYAVGKAGMAVGKAGMAVGQVAVQGAVNLGKAAASSLPLINQDDDRFAKRTGRTSARRQEEDEDEEEVEEAEEDTSSRRGLPRRPQRRPQQQQQRSRPGADSYGQEDGDDVEDEGRTSEGATQNVLTKGLGFVARGAMQAVSKVGGVAAEGFNAAAGGLKKLTATGNGEANGGGDDRDETASQSSLRSRQSALDRAGSQGSQTNRSGNYSSTAYRRSAARKQVVEEEEEEEEDEEEEQMTAKQRWLAQQKRKNTR